MVLIPSPRSNLSLMLSVPSGVFCRMQKFGKDIGEVEPGLHFYPFWYRIAYVVTKQSCTYDAPVKMAATSDDVRVNIDVVLVFQVKDAQNFIYKLGAKNFDELLAGTVDESIRMLVRKETHLTVYTLRGERADHMLTLLNEKFNDSGVVFSDVKVTSVWLPEVLAESLEKTTKLEKGMQRIVRQNEFEILQIKQTSEMSIEEIKRKTEQTLVTQNGHKKRAELEFEQRSVKAEEEGRVKLIEAEARSQVMLKQIDAQLNRTKTSLETFKVQEMARTNAAATTKKIKADEDFECKVIEAQWKEQKAICEAQAQKYEAQAEEEASKCLVAAREHEKQLREKDILCKLAQNGKFNLVGTPGDKLVNAMMTGSLKNARI